MGNIDQIILNIGMDFTPDVQKIWKLTKEEETPITVIPINELTWLFNYPFLWKGGGRWNLKPRDVIKFPTKDKFHSNEYERVMKCKLEYPIVLMKNRYRQGSRLVILDGLHRLMKSYIEKYPEIKITGVDPGIKTHILPRSKIPLIKKPDFFGKIKLHKNKR